MTSADSLRSSYRFGPKAYGIGWACVPFPRWAEPMYPASYLYVKRVSKRGIDESLYELNFLLLSKKKLNFFLLKASGPRAVSDLLS